MIADRPTNVRPFRRVARRAGKRKPVLRNNDVMTKGRGIRRVTDIAPDASANFQGSHIPIWSQ